MLEQRHHLLVIARQANPGLQAEHPRATGTNLRSRALGVRDAAARDQPVDVTGADRLLGSEAVAMDELAGDQIRDRRQPDVRVRLDVVRGRARARPTHDRGTRTGRRCAATGSGVAGPQATDMRIRPSMTSSMCSLLLVSGRRSLIDLYDRTNLMSIWQNPSDDVLRTVLIARTRSRWSDLSTPICIARDRKAAVAWLRRDPVNPAGDRNARAHRVLSLAEIDRQSTSSMRRRAPGHARHRRRSGQDRCETLWLQLGVSSDLAGGSTRPPASPS